jgi:hypothetical protein
MAEFATVDAEQQQHLQALDYANRVRLARAGMKRQIAAGELSAADIVLTSPWLVQTMSISELVMSQKQWGRARCRRLLISLGVTENKRIGTFTERQRLALADELETKRKSLSDGRPEPVAQTQTVPPPLQGTFGEHALSAA